jgi:CO/xanthine dehydrogenase FAD-binding subunit
MIPTHRATTPEYVRPTRLATALERLAGGRYDVLAGGTDFYPAYVGRALREPVLDISALAEMRGVMGASDFDGKRGHRIGALTTWSDLARGDSPPAWRCLAECAREVGGIQIQNRGTLGGNLCNASPAADGVPALLALDAHVELASVRGRRTLPLSRFILGNRKTALAADELLTAVFVPQRSRAACSCFLKLGQRRYLVISIAMIAAVLDFDAGDCVSYCGVAVGACSAAAQRLPALERALLGVPRAEIVVRLPSVLDDHALAPLSPIDDVRGTALYRRSVVRELLTRALTELAQSTAQ